MKRICAALLAVMILLSASGCHKATLEDYKLFRSSPLGFSIEYPDFWEHSATVRDGIAVFVTPTEGYGDQYNESLSVQRFALDTEEENAYNTYVRTYVSQLEGTLANFRLVTEQSTTLGGQDAYQIVYESISDDESSQLRFMQIFTEHEGQVYLVTYIAEFSNYPYFLTYVEQMLGTFHFI